MHNIRHLGNANQNRKKIPINTSVAKEVIKKQIRTSISELVENSELSYTGGKAK